MKARLTGSLTLTPDTVRAGDYFDVHGSGFNPTYGNPIIGFTGGGWGCVLDESGACTVVDIPALSGDTLPAGTYPVTASQYVRGKLTRVATATITVTE